MKMNEIYKVFTEKVNEYIQRGYYIHASSMKGHQGEVGKVDLSNGKELIRVWLSSECSKSWLSDSPDVWHGDILVLRVGKWNYPASDADRGCTTWMSDFEIIEEIIYYAISPKWYLDNLEEALKTQTIHHDRLYASTYHYPYGPNKEATYTEGPAVEAAYKYLRRKQGYQRVSMKDIKVVKMRGRQDNKAYYDVHYHGNSYRLS